MKPLTIWAASAQKQISGPDPMHIDTKRLKLEARLTNDSLWFIYILTDSNRRCFRTALSPSGKLELMSRNSEKVETIFHFACDALCYKASLSQNDQHKENLSYMTGCIKKSGSKMYPHGTLHKGTKLTRRTIFDIRLPLRATRIPPG